MGNEDKETRRRGDKGGKEFPAPCPLVIVFNPHSPFPTLHCLFYIRRPPLFVAQCDQRIDLGRTSRRDEARNQRDSEQQQGDRHESRGIGRLHVQWQT
jgi:hypothetical protein